MTTRILIRTASPDDIDAIYRLVWSGRDELPKCFPQMSAVHTMIWVTAMVKQGVTFVAEIEEDDEDPDKKGAIVGSLALEARQVPWNMEPDQFFLGDAWIFVDPGHRKGGTAVRLVERAIKEAQKRDMTAIFQIQLGGAVELKDRFMKMRGLTYIGGTFMSPRGD